MREKQWVVVDLDGTLAEYDGWQGPAHIGNPISGAKDFMQRLAERFHIVVWTTRGDVEVVEAWLKAQNIPYDSVNDASHNPPGCSSKPIGVAYVDDRAVPFDGTNYGAAYDAVCKLAEEKEDG